MTCARYIRVRCALFIRANMKVSDFSSVRQWRSDVPFLRRVRQVCPRFSAMAASALASKTTPSSSLCSNASNRNRDFALR